MKLSELEKLYNAESPVGHLSALQAVFNAGVKYGEQQAWEKFREIERQKEIALRNFGKETEVPAIMRQALEMGKAFNR